MTWDPLGDKYSVRWGNTLGTVCTDLPYGPGAANKFDLYLPADGSKETCGLVVYLHAGGFTSGDKAGDVGMLYAYRDGSASPVPVKLTFGAVGPSCFYPEDWGCFGLDQDPEVRR